MDIVVPLALPNSADLTACMRLRDAAASVRKSQIFCRLQLKNDFFVLLHAVWQNALSGLIKTQ
jgi:hypothetical protein